MVIATETPTASLELLNALLIDELSAAETYRRVMEWFPEGSPELEENSRCHRRRIAVLSERIRQLGGTPAREGKPWSVLANFNPGTARLFGQDSTITVLESGEYRNLNDYRLVVEFIDADSAELILKELLPTQESTHRRMSRLLGTSMRDGSINGSQASFASHSTTSL